MDKPSTFLGQLGVFFALGWLSDLEFHAIAKKLILEGYTTPSLERVVEWSEVDLEAITGSEREKYIGVCQRALKDLGVFNSETTAWEKYDSARWWYMSILLADIIDGKIDPGLGAASICSHLDQAYLIDDFFSEQPCFPDSSWRKYRPLIWFTRYGHSLRYPIDSKNLSQSEYEKEILAEARIAQRIIQGATDVFPGEFRKLELRDDFVGTLSETIAKVIGMFAESHRDERFCSFIFHAHVNPWSSWQLSFVSEDDYDDFIKHIEGNNLFPDSKLPPQKRAKWTPTSYEYFSDEDEEDLDHAGLIHCWLQETRNIKESNYSRSLLIAESQKKIFFGAIIRALDLLESRGAFAKINTTADFDTGIMFGSVEESIKLTEALRGRPLK